VVEPSSFNHAQEVADRFKADQPVAMDLYDVDRELSRRLIDFSSGLCYGLGGNMKKVADHIYLLTPAGVEVSDDERRKLADRSADR
jgi:cell division inhibitor SepF